MKNKKQKNKVTSTKDKEIIFFTLLMINIVLLSINIFKNYIANNSNHYIANADESENINIIDENLKKINLNGVNKLMIVAHPDDELLWGGSHLINDNYLVVCVTCGSREKRLVEFSEAMYKTGDNYITLGYPDLVNKKVDEWETVENDIYQDLKYIISYKNWDLIVTHNPLGEYGHKHHKKLSNYVTDITNKNNLYYFGIYYRKDELKEKSNLKELDSAIVKEKTNILVKSYPSQKGAIEEHQHMIKYENWIKATDWDNVVKS